MKLSEAKKLEEKYLMRLYQRQDALFARGRGMFLFDADGKKYLDFLSGIGVCALGHSPKVVVDAIKKQASMLIHTCNLYHTLPQIELAQFLSKKTGGMLSFFCNSGAEANEAAIKLARKWGRIHFSGKPRDEIITTLNSFHGRTYGALSATGQEKLKNYFKPVVPGFKHVLLNDIRALKKAVTQKTCAVILEVIQGESGVVPAEKNYLRDVQKLCRQKSILLVIDEVQTAFRTGKFFAHEHFGLKPDIVTLAKPIASGLPMGVMCAKKNIAGIFQPGDHGTTFGGTPLVCAVSLAVMREIEKKKLVAKVSAKGEYLTKKILALKAKYGFIEEARGMGLMLGVVLKEPFAKKVQKLCLERGLVLNAPSEYVLRLLPPLIVEKTHIDYAVKILAQVFDEQAKEESS